MTVHPEPDVDRSDAPAPIAPAGPSQVPEVADGVEHHLDPRSITVERIGGAIGWTITGGGPIVGLLGAALLNPMPWWGRAACLVAALLLVAGLGWLTFRWPEIQHRHKTYRVDARGIEIRRGVFWRRVINVPRLRVQHTDVAQGPIERHFGLGTLIIFTAGTDHAKVVLPGLDYPRALAIRDHLLPEEGSDAV